MGRPFIISIEGNIGSGKTTLINQLIDVGCDGSKKIVYLHEPIEVWENIKDHTGENIIQKMYKNKYKYGFSFQILAYITFWQRLQNVLKNADENTVIICERSMNSCREVFAKMFKDSGIIEEFNYKILEIMFEQVETIPLDSIIYLNTGVELCNARIKQRDRLGEEEISIEYLEKSHKYHDEWLKSIIQSDNPISILMVDVSLSDKEKVEKICDYIKNYTI